MRPAELESLATRCLSRLPGPRAPSSLLPRVLAEVESASRRRWYRRAWPTWPPACKAASAAALCVLGWLASGGAAASLVAVESFALAGTARTLWRLVVEPNAAFLAATAVAMGVSSAVVCAGISRMLWERRPQP